MPASCPGTLDRQPPSACSISGRANGIRCDLGNRRGDATGLLLLGTALQKRGQVANAHEGFDRALVLRRDLDDRPGITAVLLARGQTLLLAEDTNAAERDFGEARALYRAIRDPVGQLEALVRLARTARQGGDLPAAAWSRPSHSSRPFASASPTPPARPPFGRPAPPQDLPRTHDECNAFGRDQMD